MVMYAIAQALVQIIGVWIFIGAIAFACGRTSKLFKSKKWSIIAHGPLVWYAVFVAKITGQLNKSPKPNSESVKKKSKASILKKELGKSLTDIQDDTCFWFDNGFDGHDYSGKELKEDPTLVHWLWDGDKKEFLPLAVLLNQTAGVYSPYLPQKE